MTKLPELTIRDARLDDAPALAALMTVLGFPTEPVDMSAGLNKVLANPWFRTLVAEEDGKVLGFGGFRVGPTFEGETLEGEIIALVVDPDSRNQGVGAALVAAGEEWAREGGASMMLLSPRGDHQRAQSFYLREGYVETGVRYRKSLLGGQGGGA